MKPDANKFQFTYDITNKEIKYFSEKPDKDGLTKQFIKNTLGTSEEFITDLQLKFFREENIKRINFLLKKKIFYESDKKYLIREQNRNSLIVVMRWIWSNYSKNFDFNIDRQVESLNSKVISEIYPNVLSNIEQYYEYSKQLKEFDESKLKVNDLPISSKMTRGTIELPSLFPDD
tara:strand:- start:1190 stop:1714 length:525 start_codon:yes stop_codon:yes gene_type:complete